MTRSALLDELQRALDQRQRSARTARAYVHWVRDFLQFTEISQTPLGKEGVDAFVAHVDRERAVSASTRRQALTALAFFFRHVVDAPVGKSRAGALRAGAEGDLDRALTSAEVQAVLDQLGGAHRVIAALLVLSGLGLIEACRLRVRDLDLAGRRLVVRQSTAEERKAVLPAALLAPLGKQLERSRQTHQADGAFGGGHVLLPPEAQHQTPPPATNAWEWQWLFPGARSYEEPSTGQRYRHHQHESGVQRAVRNAGRRAGLTRRVTCQVLRSTFVQRIRDAGFQPPIIDYLLGRGDRAHEVAALRALAAMPSEWTL